MRKQHEINGIPVRDEIKRLIESILENECSIEIINISTCCIERINGGHVSVTNIRFKQTEMDSMIESFKNNSIFRWSVSEIHNEGNDDFFGKSFILTKTLDSSGCLLLKTNNT